jgi:hypothetical protein
MDTNVFDSSKVALVLEADAVQEVALEDDGAGGMRIGDSINAMHVAALAITANISTLEHADNETAKVQRKVLESMDAGTLIHPKDEAIDNCGVPSAHTKESFGVTKRVLLQTTATASGRPWSHMAKPLHMIATEYPQHNWIGKQFTKRADGTYGFSDDADKDFIKAMGNYSRDDIMAAWKGLQKDVNNVIKRSRNRLLELRVEPSADTQPCDDKDAFHTYVDEDGETQTVQRYADPRVDRFHQVKLKQSIKEKRALKDDPVRNLDRERLLNMVEAIEDKIATIKKGEFSDNTNKMVFKQVLDYAKKMRGWIEEPASDAPKDRKHRGIRS